MLFQERGDRLCDNTQARAIVAVIFVNTLLRQDANADKPFDQLIGVSF